MLFSALWCLRCAFNIAHLIDKIIHSLPSKSIKLLLSYIILLCKIILESKLRRGLERVSRYSGWLSTNSVATQYLRQVLQSLFYCPRPKIVNDPKSLVSENLTVQSNTYLLFDCINLGNCIKKDTFVSIFIESIQKREFCTILLLPRKI